MDADAPAVRFFEGAIELVGWKVGVTEALGRAGDGDAVAGAGVEGGAAAVDDEAVALRAAAAPPDADVDLLLLVRAQAEEHQRARVADRGGWSERERGGHVPAQLVEVPERAHAAVHPPQTARRRVDLVPRGPGSLQLPHRDDLVLPPG